MLIKDVMVLPKVMQSRETTDAESEFNSEALELFGRLMVNKEVKK